MSKQNKAENNKEEGKNYYSRIIRTLEEDISRLEKELNLYKETPRIARGIRKNLRDRKEDVQYYKDLSVSYKKDKWIN